MTVIQIRELAVERAEAARAIRDKAEEQSRTMTAEENLEFDKLLKESENFEADAARQERLEATEKRQNAPAEKVVTPAMSSGQRIEVASGQKLFRSGKLRAFRGKNAEADAYAAGKFLLATVMGNAESRQWCRDHGIELRVQTEGINTAGGFVVPDVMERGIIDLREEYGVMRREARVVPMASDHSLIPRRAGGVEAYFVGETTAITEDDKTWSSVELTAKKLACLTRMSTDLSEDAIINIADDLTGEMALAFAKKEDECGLDGDGTNTYGGMLGIRMKMVDGLHLGSWHAAITPGEEWNELTVADLTGVMAVLPLSARANAKWYCSPRAKAETFDRLALAIGGNTAINMGEGAMAKFMGYPIVEMNAMPSADAMSTATSEIMILFGDMRRSTTFGDRRGITIQVSADRYMEYDQIGIKATERFCIVNHDIGGAAATAYGPMRGLFAIT